MKVLLKEDVDHLGYAGEVFEVSAGYGRNFLIPRGMAELATPSAMRRAELWRERAEARRAQLRAQYQALSEKISAVTVTFEAKAGESGKLYGSITSAQIADALHEALDIEVDRRKLESEPLRQVGEHKVSVRLDKDHTPEFTVVIKPEGGELPAPPQPVAIVEEDEFEED